MRNPTGTPREWEIAATYCRYGCHKDTANALGITIPTVGNAMTNLYRKYDVHSLIELVQIAGWLQIPPDNMPKRSTPIPFPREITAATLSGMCSPRQPGTK
jgi:hypothetical protein